MLVRKSDKCYVTLEARYATIYQRCVIQYETGGWGLYWHKLCIRKRYEPSKPFDNIFRLPHAVRPPGGLFGAICFTRAAAALRAFGRGTDTANAHAVDANSADVAACQTASGGPEYRPFCRF